METPDNKTNQKRKIVSVPKHLWRFSTPEAIASLARRFDLPNSPNMQDWEWEVADSERINEFLAVYEGGELTQDERFTLMEMIPQSFEDLSGSLAKHPSWNRVLELLDQNIDLHIYSVWYWSDLENDNQEDTWRITPFLREILENHRAHFSST